MKKILIVDDDPSIGEMLEELLNKNGYEPLRATSGAEALAVISACPPDLILLDLMLPGISGEELLSKIKTAYPQTAVIVVSAKEELQTRISILRSGADDYITKPFDTDELLARLEAVLRRSAKEQISEKVLQYKDIVMSPDKAHVTVAEWKLS